MTATRHTSVEAPPTLSPPLPGLNLLRNVLPDFIRVTLCTVINVDWQALYAISMSQREKLFNGAPKRLFFRDLLRTDIKVGSLSLPLFLTIYLNATSNQK